MPPSVHSTGTTASAPAGIGAPVKMRTQRPGCTLYAPVLPDAPGPAPVPAAPAGRAEGGTPAPLEDVAERAGVGIGTLYRHFPTRQALLEAVYVDEVNTLCRSAEEVAGDPPWEAPVAWLSRFVEYVGTKQALAEELFADGRNSEVFKTCHAAF